MNRCDRDSNQPSRFVRRGRLSRLSRLLSPLLLGIPLPLPVVEDVHLALQHSFLLHQAGPLLLQGGNLLSRCSLTELADRLRLSVCFVSPLTSFFLLRAPYLLLLLVLLELCTRQGADNDDGAKGPGPYACLELGRARPRTRRHDGLRIAESTGG